jgi:small subunit ribosomal protein S15e
LGKLLSAETQVVDEKVPIPIIFSECTGGFDGLSMSKFAQRNYTFRGKTLDDLKSLEVNQFVDLLGSHGRRFAHRTMGLPHIKLIKKLKAAREKVAGQSGIRPPVVRTHLRAMVILPEFVDNVIGIYNGKEFTEIQVKPDMIGHVLAEFSMAKRIVKHSKAGVGATRSSSATALK